MCSLMDYTAPAVVALSCGHDPWPSHLAVGDVDVAGGKGWQPCRAAKPGGSFLGEKHLPSEPC